MVAPVITTSNAVDAKERRRKEALTPAHMERLLRGGDAKGATPRSILAGAPATAFESFKSHASFR